MTKKQFGAQIRKAREAKPMKQSELAKAAGVPGWAVAQLETGRSVGQEKTTAIAKVLGLDAPEKFKADGKKQATKKKTSDKPAAPFWPLEPKSVGAAIDTIMSELSGLDDQDAAAVLKFVQERMK